MDGINHVYLKNEIGQGFSGRTLLICIVLKPFGQKRHKANTDYDYK